MTRQTITNREIANVLRAISLFLEAEGVAWKPEAYERAADLIDTLGEELSITYKRCGVKCVDDLPGIGESIAKKIAELVRTGSLRSFEALKRKHPYDIVGLTEIQEVGPKTALKLYRKLKIKKVADLERAAKDGKIRTVPGFGRKTEDRILKGLGFLREHSGRFRLHDALPLAESVVAQLKKLPGVTHCDVAGSIRRRKETIGDIDLIITTSKPELAIEAFQHLPEVQETIDVAPTFVTVRFKFGMNGDLRILKPDEYGSLSVHFTGSKDHNILIRERAIKFGMKLSEFGLFKGKKRMAAKTEEDVYRLLKMDWMPPEIREATDEVKRAIVHDIPDFIGYDSLKGDLQTQTDWTDGKDSIADMAKAAKALGLSYIAITDHTQSLPMASGLNEKRLLEQGREIDKINETLTGFRILKSTECDIRKDGSLDLMDAVLQTLDLVGVSIHTYFTLDEQTQTERIIRALKHPLVNILFHPTGRIVNAREAFKVDMAKIIRAAKQYNVALEVNGSHRLDLKDTHVRMAVDAGAKLVINSDAHTVGEFDFLKFGIATARRGWAKKSDVLNTKSVDQLLKVLKKKKS